MHSGEATSIGLHRGGGIAALLALMLSAAAGVAAAHPAPTKVAVADGVFLFRTEPYGDVGLDGNSVAILSDEGVLVFDANGTPAAAAAVLAEIRKLTDKPVRYLVLSHWHWDHWYGAEVYKDAYPELTIITQERGRRMMVGPALAFNKPGLERDLPGHVASLEKKVAALESASPPPPDLPKLRQLLADDRFFLEQKKRVRHTFPNLTFADQLTLYLGEREIQVLHYGRAVTPGDTFLYLPKEKLLVTGDLLVNPVSFALGCYPSGWLAALEKMDALDASLIVPGHGEPLRDEALLHATTDVFRELLQRGKDAKARGLGPDQAKEEILPTLRPLMLTITHDDPKQRQAFEVYLVDWYLHRVYDELSGPLGDDIGPIPAK
jgi:glyoxylase-like metal-dependent hydrolase (beta-lactamase superfamily II)